MNNILITGGLGYIGSEIIKISNFKKNKITILDKKKPTQDQKKIFKSKRIKFIRYDLCKLNTLPKYISKFDTIIHLAAVTKVPKLKQEASKKIDKKIMEVGIKGTLNLILKMNKFSHLIFPSTHLVFEKTKKKQKFNEKSSPMPFLAYSKSKFKGEKIIKQKLENFTILRLGSVYGYTKNEHRMFNMPNLFPKLAKKKLPLKLFSNGSQLKSIISHYDVARFMLFSINLKKKNQIYNVVSQNLTVLKIAMICKDFIPNLKIMLTNDPIPNPGYSMCSNKMLDC